MLFSICATCESDGRGDRLAVEVSEKESRTGQVPTRMSVTLKGIVVGIITTIRFLACYPSSSLKFLCPFVKFNVVRLYVLL